MTVPSDTIQIVISVLQIYGVVDSTGYYYRDYFDVVLVSLNMFRELAGNVSKILCLLMLVATFMSYTFPFTFQKVFHEKRRNYLYLGGVLFCAVQILYNNIQTMASIHTNLSDEIIAVWYLSVHVIGSTVFAIIITFYVLVIVVIVLYGRKQTNAGNTNLAQRRQLISVIVYATMPNILVVLDQISKAFQLARATLPMKSRTADNPVIVMGSIATLINRHASYARVVILTISTFVAFTSYRKALLAMIPERFKVLQGKSSATTQTLFTRQSSISNINV
uniref:G protein-coupled receptor n=1 Tax=Steinernema glaseri TaxID=37863 RepID=A0A1I7XXT8_9BILA